MTTSAQIHKTTRQQETKQENSQYSRLLNPMMLITQRPHPPSLKQQADPFSQLFPNPPHRKRPEYMPMSHKQHITRLGLLFQLPNSLSMEPISDVLDQPIQPLCDIRGRLPAWAPIPPDIPAALPPLLPLFADLRTSQTLVVPVVPLSDVLCNLYFGFASYTILS